MSRHRYHRYQHLLGLIVIVAALGACKSNPVGRQCFIGASADGGVPETIVASPALECQSRTCLHVAGKAPDLCTGECATDDDCETSAESPCQRGFVCTVPVVTGAFCCKKLCMCKDYVIIPDGGIPPPAACDETIAANECCNLPNRRGNSMYPVCGQ